MPDIIPIANKITIRESGNVMIPGCEPVSELSSPLFAQRLNCKASEIPATQAMKLIPGSYIEVNPFTPSQRYLVLPNGPPPDGNDCPCRWLGDWYALLRGTVTEETKQSPLQCNSEAFDFNWCRISDPEAEAMAR